MTPGIIYEEERVFKKKLRKIVTSIQSDVPLASMIPDIISEEERIFREELREVAALLQ